MSNLIEVKKTTEVFADSEAETWVTDVDLMILNNGAETLFTVRVMADSLTFQARLISFEAPYDAPNFSIDQFNNDVKRNHFEWRDYMLDNIGGNVQHASILAALALVLGEDLVPPVIC